MSVSITNSGSASLVSLMQRRWQDWRDMVAANSAGDHLRAEEALSAYQRDSQAIPGIGVGTLSQQADDTGSSSETGEPSLDKPTDGGDSADAARSGAARDDATAAAGNGAGESRDQRTAASGTDRRLEAVIASYELN